MERKSKERRNKQVPFDEAGLSQTLPLACRLNQAQQVYPAQFSVYKIKHSILKPLSLALRLLSGVLLLLTVAFSHSLKRESKCQKRRVKWRLVWPILKSIWKRKLLLVHFSAFNFLLWYKLSFLLLLQPLSFNFSRAWTSWNGISPHSLQGIAGNPKDIL